MPLFPLLLLNEPSAVPKPKRSAGRQNSVLPAPARQAERLAPQFAALQRLLETRNLSLAADPAGADAEEILVLETVGSVENFQRALRGLDGLSWLAEYEEDDLDPDEDFPDSSHPNRKLNGRLYLVTSNQRGLEQILSLWTRFQQDPERCQLPRGQGKWKDLFHHLRTVRRWNAEDRVRETGLLEAWEESRQRDDSRIRVEVELTFKPTAELWSTHAATVRELIITEGGSVLSECCIPEIAYHAFLAQLSTASVENLLRDPNVALAACNRVLFYRPAGQIVLAPGESASTKHEILLPPLPPRDAPPVVGLLDGLPLQNHQLLAGRLRIDDPDNVEEGYVAAARRHGTGMASLILHGDLSTRGEPLSTPLYVRPVLTPYPGGDPDSWNERTPETQLIPDLMHRAVRRMFEGDGDESATAPSVGIINLSLGDESRPFDRYPFPWARLLDYLSWRYRVLFVVSAGNHSPDLELPTEDVPATQLLSNQQQLAAAVLRLRQSQARSRRLLAPAESINSITVGALHHDEAAIPPGLVEYGLALDVYPGYCLPSPYSAQGPGFRRAVKPEVLFPGGRGLYHPPYRVSQPTVELRGIDLTDRQHGPGQKVASPRSPTGTLDFAVFTCGTSNATALATRSAAQVYEALLGLRSEPGGHLLTDEGLVVLMKALLIHSASWGDAKQQASALLGDADRRSLGRLLGFGVAQPAQVMACADHRTTMIRCGSLAKDEAAEFQAPLPPSLSGQSVRWKLAVTLAWLTPIEPTTQKYRGAQLWFEVHPSSTGSSPTHRTGSLFLDTEFPEETGPAGGSSGTSKLKQHLRLDSADVDHNSTTRGTVQHKIWTADRPAVVHDGDTLRVVVACREDAGGVREPIPFGLAISLEVAPESGLRIYHEIADRLRTRIPVVVGAAG